MILAYGRGTKMSDVVQNSILLSLKKSLDIDPSDTAFDVDLILLINSVFAELNQLGVGPKEVFSIDGEDAQWSDFSTNENLNMVQAYMKLEIKMMFDPPTASVLTAMEKKRDEYEWRLNVAGDSYLYAKED